jgi:hypothetical protein
LAVGAAAVGDASSVSADHRFRAASAVLNGENEALQGGDEDGFGAAGVVIHPRSGRLCYFVTAGRIAPATLAHIHRGAAGVNGPVVVDFEAPADGFSAECLSGLDTNLLGEIAHNPSGFYVNVHNADFPGGAIRGQLR